MHRDLRILVQPTREM